MAEAFADGQTTQEELAAALMQAQAVIQGDVGSTRTNARRGAAWCANTTMDALGIARSVAWGAAYARPRAKGAERIAQAHLLRDVFDNPFQPVSIPSDWLTSSKHTVVKLAQAAYAERNLPSGLLDSARLAVLADALEEVGCPEVNIVAHCRIPGTHVRGCWAVDSILAKS
jgi:hypothetical protein